MTCNGNINQTFIIESVDGAPTLSGCSGVYTNNLFSCSGDTNINLSENEIIINKNLNPSNNNLKIGDSLNRFREINTLSGTSTYWSSTTISTETIYLGLDSNGENRIISSDTSILSNDILNGGVY